MNQDAIILTTIFAYFIGFLISVLITRLVFSIPTFLRYQKAKINILAEMAIKNGVEPDKISGIMNKYEIR
jgi:uncharacterized protein YybS (DUF2232 family)